MQHAALLACAEAAGKGGGVASASNYVAVQWVAGGAWRLARHLATVALPSPCEAVKATRFAGGFAGLDSVARRRLLATMSLW
jgi:hypothetical protein